jgi:LysM repeat protein
MLNRQPQQKHTTRRVDRLTVGVGIIFALVFLTAALLYSVYARPQTTPPPQATLTVSPGVVAETTQPPTMTALPEPTLVLPSSTPQTYLVKPGDTLSGIAETFGVTVEALILANALNSDTIIHPDQVLVIPGGALVLTPLASSVTGVPPNVTRYQVAGDDTLESIAFDRGVSVDALRSVNAMVGDALIAGQYLSIPGGGVAPTPWQFSRLSGDLNRAYPLTLATERFTLRYQPELFPAQDPEALARVEMEGLAFLEALTGSRLEVTFDVYVAGSVFEPPNRALRGITYSAFQKTFFLHDGTGNETDQRYIATHELTHLFFSNTFGTPASTMLSEGTAVYTGMEFIRGSRHMPLEAFCAAYLQAGVLPDISGSLSFTGHILDLENYYAAGCFVKYLVDAYGIDALKLVYHAGDYSDVYGRSLVELEQDWRVYLATVPVPAGLDPPAYVSAVKRVEDSYGWFFARFNGTAKQLSAYRELDRARIALLEGDLDALQNSLDAFNALR